MTTPTIDTSREFLAYVSAASAFSESADREWIGTYWSEVCSTAVTDAYSYEEFEAAVLSARAARDSGSPVFRLDEENAEWPLFHLLAVNADDPGMCEWLRRAEVGDQCPDFSGLVRIS